MAQIAFFKIFLSVVARKDNNGIIQQVFPFQHVIDFFQAHIQMVGTVRRALEDGGTVFFRGVHRVEGIHAVVIEPRFGREGVGVVRRFKEHKSKERLSGICPFFDCLNQPFHIAFVPFVGKPLVVFQHVFRGDGNKNRAVELRVGELG